MKYIHLILFFLCVATQAATAQSSARKGKDYAVFFYVTDFDNGWQPLPKTENEMVAISRELQNNYGFECENVKNPSLQTILDVLQRYEARSYGANDQVLFFFSMHGNYDERADRAYLVPKTGSYNMRDYRTWLSYDELSQELSFVTCKHIYLALDACYSGAFGDRHKTRPTELAFDAVLPCADNVGEILKKQSRLYATAGGKVRVPDESKFAKRFLDALVSGGKDGIVSDRDIIYQISSITGAVIPEYGTFKGDDRGSFLFVRKDACANQTPTNPNVVTPSYNVELDKADWRVAKLTNTVAAYEKYKREHANGFYVDDAQEAINRIKEANNNTTYVPPQSNPQTTTPSVSRLSFEPEMVRVDGGTFQMGSNSGDSDEKPVHSVSLNTFYIGKYEVTQKQWRDVMGSDPPNLNFKGCDQCPVERVSWDDIQEYLKKLNSKTSKNYRLPTEAEWEYAARGGKQSKGYTYSGSNDLKAVAWYTDNSDSKTHPVGTKNANELGIYDMSGNVWEWCSDWKGEYSSASQQNPIGATTGSNRVNRGGSWFASAGICRVAYRISFTPTYRNYDLGFRLALSPPQ